MDMNVAEAVDLSESHVEPIAMRYRDQTVGFPKGWYCVAESKDIVEGVLKSVSYLDQQMIVYRDANGDAKVADAYCPHLGAHLASHDGCITGGEVVCPFHKWRFDGATGKCNSIPYTNIVPPQAKLTMYPTVERFGMVLMWYHPEGKAPEFQPYDFEEYASAEQPWMFYTEYNRISRAPFRDIMENLFDTAHIQQLHHSTGMPEIAKVARTDYGMRVTYGAPANPEEFPLTFMEFNFSALSIIHHITLGEGFGFQQIGTLTPIDHESFQLRARMYIRDTGSAEINEAIGGAFASRVLSEISQDAKVLNFKKHLKNPIICAGDGPIMKFRTYAKEILEEV
jgi:nitrite reductase/ring-hydroxylating ferredoxin subunit